MIKISRSILSPNEISKCKHLNYPQLVVALSEVQNECIVHGFMDVGEILERALIKLTGDTVNVKLSKVTPIDQKEKKMDFIQLTIAIRLRPLLKFPSPRHH